VRTPSLRFDPEGLEDPGAAELINCGDQGQDGAEPQPSFEDPPEAPLFFDDPPEVPGFADDSPIADAVGRERIDFGKTSRSKESSNTKKPVADVSESSHVKPASSRRRADAQEPEAEAKERYRRKLTKGLKQKHEKYRNG
jgi:hypothetical protein